MDNVLELSGDSPEPTEPNEIVLMKLPHAQEEMDALLRKELENHKEERPKAEVPKRKKKKLKKRPQKDIMRKTETDDDVERIQEEKRKAYEEEEMRIEAEMRRKLEEEEKKKKNEEERRKKEEEAKREEEINRLAMERKQKEREELGLEEEDDDDDDEDDNDDDGDEYYNLRGDVFRVPRRRIPGSRRPTEVHHPPLPPGCFISEITVSCSNAKLTGVPPISDPDVKSLDLLGKHDQIILY